MAGIFEIITDATVDFIPDLIEEHEITVIPMEFHIGGSSYQHHYDFREYGAKEFYDALQSGLNSTTSQVTPNHFEDVFRDFARQGKDFIYLGFSSGMSGTYGASLLAIRNLQEEFPEVKMMAVDTLCASGGEGLAVYIASKMRENGASMEEIATWVTEKASKKIVHWISVDDLKHLARGGRISAVSASIGTVLSVKPILRVNEEGKLEVVDKCRGNKAKMKNLAQKFEAMWEPDEHREIVIFHAQAKEEAQKTEEMLRSLDLCKKYQPEILITEIGPVVGSHTGKGCVCVAFWGKNRG
ncbi:MAG: DegV family protein [Filifactor alocis]|nr:DegV family protein [Filifactor alocis]